MKQLRIGILAMQGAFIEHQQMLNTIGIDSFLIRSKQDLSEDFDGLILPGGESTAIRKLLVELDIFNLLQQMIKDGLPTLGTCAGMILLAKQVDGAELKNLADLNVNVVRNAYGRQIDSFVTNEKFNTVDVEMVFIRAPFISDVFDSSIKILAMQDDNIVAVCKENILALSFHPELTSDTTVHEFFINEMVLKKPYINN